MFAECWSELQIKTRFFQEGNGRLICRNEMFASWVTMSCDNATPLSGRDATCDQEIRWTKEKDEDEPGFVKEFANLSSAAILTFGSGFRVAANDSAI